MYVATITWENIRRCGRRTRWCVPTTLTIPKTTCDGRLTVKGIIFFFLGFMLGIIIWPLPFRRFRRLRNWRLAGLVYLALDEHHTSLGKKSTIKFDIFFLVCQLVHERAHSPVNIVPIMSASDIDKLKSQSGTACYACVMSASDIPKLKSRSGTACSNKK